MATFLFVAGAWHGAWCWERIVPPLEAAGHRALAPDLLGMGADRTPLHAVSLAAWADQIAAIVVEQSERVILVGHSRAGVVISEVAERVPERIATLAYLAAFLLPAGATLAAIAQMTASGDAPGPIVPQPDGSLCMREDMVGPLMYNRTAPDWLAKAVARLSPEPAMSLSTPLRITAERFGSVPRAYIECAHDQVVPIELQRSMQAGLPCSPVYTLPADHSPFYSDPDALVGCLVRLAREVEERG